MALSEPVAIVNTPQRLLLIFTWFPLVIAVALTCGRFYSRYLKKLSWLWDDWLSLIGMIILLGLQTSLIIGTVHGGLGLPFATLRPEQQLTWLKLRGAAYVMYVATVAVVQSRILCLYLRVFGKTKKSFRWVCYGLLACVFVWCFITTFVTVFACTPVEKPWSPHIKGGSCGDTYAICGATGIIHVVLDFIILMLPMPMIWKLQTALSKKIIFTIVFSLGLIATIFAFLRLSCMVSLVKINQKDLTGSEWLQNLFMVLEATFGVLCVSLPVTPPAWAKFSSSRVGSSIKNILGSGSKTSRSSSSTWKGDHSSLANRKGYSGGTGSGDSMELPLHGIPQYPEPLVVRHDLTYEVTGERTRF